MMCKDSCVRRTSCGQGKRNFEAKATWDSGAWMVIRCNGCWNAFICNGSVAKDWGLTSQEMGWIGSINSIGMAVGALIFGILSDKIGRKSVFIITLLLFSIGSGLTALTTTLAMFLVLRFLIGMGLGGELPVASTLVSESVEAHERGKIVVLLESFWAGGWLIAPYLVFCYSEIWLGSCDGIECRSSAICFIFKVEFAGFSKIPKG